MIFRNLHISMYPTTCTANNDEICVRSTNWANCQGSMKNTLEIQSAIKLPL